MIYRESKNYTFIHIQKTAETNLCNDLVPYQAERRPSPSYLRTCFQLKDATRLPVDYALYKPAQDHDMSASIYTLNAAKENAMETDQ
jgi:hypothetical protein